MDADWEIVVRLRIPMLVDHDVEDAEKLARECIAEDTLVGLADFETMEIVSLTPVKDKT